MLGSNITDKVLVKLEEYTPFKQDVLLAFGSGSNNASETRPINSYIADQMEQAANEMLRVMPLRYVLYKTSTPTCAADTADSHIGSFQLPEEFLRLHTLQMSGWTRPIHTTINEEGPEYTAQLSKWTRGTKQKPVAVLSGMGTEAVSATTSKVLKYYSVDDNGHQVLLFRYVPMFNLNNHYGDEAAELIALNCARKVAEIFGMTEAVTMFTNEINTVLENVRQ